LLLNSGIGIPTTGFNSPLDTNDLIKMVGGSPLIVLLEGTQGKVLYLLKLKKRQKVSLMLSKV
jgi:ribosomal protein S6--L-glutamate ligase